MHGLVIKSTGSWYTVKTDGGAVLPCKIKGNFRLKGMRSTNPVAVGDYVTIVENQEGTAFITDIDDRKNYIIRKSPNLSKQSHILAANVDQAFLVITVNYPQTSTTFIDRFLATAMAYSVPALLVVNKVDLLSAPDDAELLSAFAYLYRSIGYTVLPTSTLTGQGMDALRQAVAGKTTLLSGNSGVGKTSIINALVPDAGLRVGDVSQSHHTGMHTTTFSEMLDLPGGGCLIDTPGVKGFGTIDFERAQVAHYFPEIFKYSEGCRYGNCTHTHEPHCAVREAVEQSLISQSRYASYLSIIDDDPSDKYRKPF